MTTTATMGSRYLSMLGMREPSAYPASVTPSDQTSPPATCHEELRCGMSTTPATGLITVRTNGMKRAMTTGLRLAVALERRRGPGRRPRCSRARPGRSSSGGPARRPIRYPTCAPSSAPARPRPAAAGQREVHGVVGRGRAQQAGREQQRVAGQEDPDQQARSRRTGPGRRRSCRSCSAGCAG